MNTEQYSHIAVLGNQNIASLLKNHAYCLTRFSGRRDSIQFDVSAIEMSGWRVQDAQRNRNLISQVQSNAECTVFFSEHQHWRGFPAFLCHEPRQRWCIVIVHKAAKA